MRSAFYTKRLQYTLSKGVYIFTKMWIHHYIECDHDNLQINNNNTYTILILDIQWNNTTGILDLL